MATRGIFFIIPECVYSPMSVNSICISVNGRNFHQEISAGTRENLSNLLRLNGGVPSPASVFSNSSQKKKKKSCFISQRLAHHPPLPAQLGGPGWSVALHARYKLYSGHCANPLHLFHSLLCSTNRRNKTSNSRMLHWEQAHSILSPLSCCSYYFNLLILQGTHQQQDSRPDLISKAMNVPPRAGKELIRVQGKLTGQCGRGAGALKQ